MLIRDLIALYHNPEKTYPKTWLSACHEYGRSDIREAFDSALYVSSSKKGVIEDETGRGLFPDAGNILLPKCTCRVFTESDLQRVTRLICRNCDRIGVFCDRHCDGKASSVEGSYSKQPSTSGGRVEISRIPAFGTVSRLCNKSSLEIRHLQSIIILS